ncbi:MAG: EpsG family protein [Tannerella sp.]|jgi:hypothetical protein|nr:EpsG family protein [Tannerella sp.]
MIPVEYYKIAYYAIIGSILLFVLLHALKDGTLYASNRFNNIMSFILILIVVLFFGLRDPMGNWRYLGDTSNYTRLFNHFDPSVYEKEPGFNMLMKFGADYLNIELFYILCACLYIIPVYIVFRKWYNNYAFYALALYISMISFWGYGINGIRNGLAASIFIFSFLFYEKKPVMFLCMLISVTFHNSMILPLLAFMVSSFYKNTKVYTAIWFAAIFFSLFFGHIIENLHFQPLISSTGRVENFFVNELDGETVQRGFRIDFIIYSFIPILLGMYYRYKLKFNDVFYVILLNTYIIANSVWIILIRAAYTNRIAYLSWFIISIVIVYPLLKKHLVKYQPQKLALLILASLVVTFFYS